MATFRSRYALALCLAWAFSPLQAATFTVNSTDTGTTSGCDSINDCTLEDAVEAAEASAGTDTIRFNITGTGTFDFRAMTFTSPVVVDGRSQPGTLANTLATGTNAVFRIRATETWIFSAAARDSVAQGIEFQRDLQSQATGLRILGCVFLATIGSSLIADETVFVGSALRQDRGSRNYDKV